MRDFLREYGKIAGIAAGAAFFLSFITGLVARNPFGTALLRGLLLAVVFAALAAGAGYLVRSYLLAGGERPRGGDPAQVDITLPEEPPTAARFRKPADESAEEAEELSEAVQGPAGSGSAEYIEEADLAPIGDEDEPGDAGDSRGAGQGGEAASVSGEAAGPESAGETGLPQRNGYSRNGPAAGGDQRLDSLPDIAALAGPGTGGAGGERTRAPAPEEVIRRNVGEEDPAALAKAIRTVLKRDERG